MAVTEVRDTTGRNFKQMSEARMGVSTRTLAAALVLAKNSAPVQFLDPGGATRTVDLPAEADSDGLVFFIVNAADAAEDLTVRDDAAATVGTVSQNEVGMFVCNGVVWRALVGANT